ncbi:phage tail assembly chaperone [Aliisedimentitalea scapharcae]|uniref:Phage tail assembly chaperone n=1 Tax=Aliisedimentitalea scapharcae TaxID=1524259 RepID=A0ABZ2Y1I3_9RHOB|nr:phage tail assembly chaperone [Rhodobacteraceae bacterium M382]
MSRFDWPALMRAGIQFLRLTPEQFWALTPAELKLMLGQAAGKAPMGRDGLNALLAAYPDRGPAGPEQGDDDE